MSEQHFTATIEQSGNRLVIGVPFDPDALWGRKQRHHVRGTIAGHPIRGPLALDGARYVLRLNPAWRGDTGVVAGAVVAVVLAAEGPQLDQIAPDIAAALDAEPEAKDYFAALATFYRKGYLRWIEGARSAETRSARVVEMVLLLKAGRKQR